MVHAHAHAQLHAHAHAHAHVHVRVHVKIGGLRWAVASCISSATCARVQSGEDERRACTVVRVQNGRVVFLLTIFLNFEKRELKRERESCQLPVEVLNLSLDFYEV